MPLKKNTVLTTKGAIKYLKISKPTFLKYCREGRIKAIKAGKGWKVLQSELDRFLRGEGRGELMIWSQGEAYV